MRLLNKLMNKHSYILPVEIDYWHMHHLLFHLTSSVHIIENTNTWMRGRREKTRDENKQVSVTQPHRWTKALWLCNIHVQHTLIHLYLIYLYVVLGHYVFQVYCGTLKHSYSWYSMMEEVKTTAGCSFSYWGLTEMRMKGEIWKDMGEKSATAKTFSTS